MLTQQSVTLDIGYYIIVFSSTKETAMLLFVVWLLTLCVHGIVSSGNVPLDEHCDDVISLNDADKLTVANWTYLRMRDTCRIHVIAPTKSGVYFTSAVQTIFTILDLNTPQLKIKSTGRRGDFDQSVDGNQTLCPEVRLDIEDSITGTSITPDGGLCEGHLSTKRFVSSGPEVMIVLTYNVTSNITNTDKLSLKLLAVRFHEEPCDNGEFSCDNERCVASSLTCNDDDDCGDDSDESDGCLLSSASLVVVGVVSGCLLVAVVVAGVFLYRYSGSRRTWWGDARLLPGATTINDDETDHVTRKPKNRGRSSAEKNYGTTSLL